MTKILFYPAITLDGFIAKSDGDSGWVTAEDERLFADEVQKAGCVIVGSRTFRQFEGNIYPVVGATTFVCSSRSETASRTATPGVVYVGGDVQAIVRQIQAAGFASAVLSGGGDTNGRFVEAGAIDEMLVSIYPCFFGVGLPVFGKWQVKLDLELLGTRQLGAGVIRNHYRVVRQ